MLQKRSQYLETEESLDTEAEEEEMRLRSESELADIDRLVAPSPRKQWKLHYAI